MKNKELQDLANIMRRDVIEMTTFAGSGHPTSCMSIAEIMSALFFNEMNYYVLINFWYILPRNSKTFSAYSLSKLFP